MAGVTLFGYHVIKGPIERKIHKLFTSYEESLLKQKQTLSDEITEWADATMRTISDYALKQKYLLDQEYTRRIEDMKGTWDRFVEELRVYEQMKKLSQSTNYFQQCQALKFELAPLEYSGQSIPFVEVHSGRKTKVMDQAEYNTTGTVANNLVHSRRSTDDYGIGNSIDSYSKLHANITEVNHRETNGQGSMVSSMSDNNRSVDVHNGQEVSEKRNEGPVDKCPICFMIFPQTMPGRDRTQHVHEHYTDD